jgi:hypothetical protein
MHFGKQTFCPIRINPKSGISGFKSLTWSSVYPLNFPVVIKSVTVSPLLNWYSSPGHVEDNVLVVEARVKKGNTSMADNFISRVKLS